MSKHKYTNAVCIIIVAAMLFVTVLFCAGGTLGITAVAAQLPYVEKLFSTDRVHSLDIEVDADTWNSMLENAADKEYIPCNVVVDGESYKNVALRTKGNSSLSSIISSDSDRYSFKIEFDHYNSNETYYGLDKLALNNIVQDNTYLKDYLSYTMMRNFQAYSPLCSFIYITVNGEDWGLYLAVEGIEEAFAQRNFDTQAGNIYKPDSMDMMNGGNAGGDAREMPDFSEGEFTMPQADENGTLQMPDFENNGNGAQTPSENTGQQTPQGETAPQTESNQSEDNTQFPFGNTDDTQSRQTQRGGMGGMGGSSTDVALVYTDDAFDSYQNIFDNAISDVSDSDKSRLISSIKQLNEGTNLEEVVNVDEVLRYFVVHNFVLNFDSYTGSMMHNYYLYEEDGQLSMIAWDYNLAFGGFGNMGGGQMNFTQETENTVSTDTATTQINFPIDTPVSGTTLEDRPILGQLLNNETYLETYHSLFSEFISSYFDSGDFSQEIDKVISLISPYIEKDPTAFCTYEEFLDGAQNLKDFCLLRAESVNGQLDGSIPATSEGQSADSNNLVDGSSIDMQAMGSSSSGFGGRSSMTRNKNPEDSVTYENTQPENQDTPQASSAELPERSTVGITLAATNILSTAAGETEPQEDSFTPPSGEQRPQGGQMPENGEMPTGGQFPGDTQSVQEESSAAEGSASDNSGDAAGDNAGNTAGENNMPGGQNWQEGNFTFPGNNTTSGTTDLQASNRQTWIWLGLSILILALGLLFAKCFKQK